MAYQTDIQHDAFTFVGCTFQSEVPQTYEEPGEPASVAYERIYLTADPAQKDLGEYLDPKWIDQAELAIINHALESAEDARAESRADARSMADAY